MTKGTLVNPLARKSFLQVLTSEKYFKWTLIIPLLVVLAIFMLYPLIYCMYFSTTKYHLGGAPEFIGFDNYRALLSSPAFWEALGRTLYVLVVCISVELILGMAIAYLFNRTFKGQNIVRGLCLLPLLIAPLAMSQMWCNILRTGGIANRILSWFGIAPVDWFSSHFALYSIMVMTIWQWFPFSVFVLVAGLRSLPRDQFEAANVDGASGWFTFRTITLPMLSPLITIIILLRTCWLIRIFDPLYGTTRGGVGTEILDWYLYRMSFVYFDIGGGAALGVFSLFITLIICAFLLRGLMSVLGGAER